MPESPASSPPPHWPFGKRLVYTVGQRRKIIYAAISIATLAVVTAVGARRFVDSGTALRLANEAVKFMDQEDWESAESCIQKARTLRPEYPEVQRATAEYVLRIGGDPRSAISILDRLVARPEAAFEDRLRLAEAHLGTGSSDQARRIYESIFPADRERPQARKLLARILLAEGRTELATKELRAALEEDHENPESRLELAVLDMRREAFSERENASLSTIWMLASDPGKAGLRAMEVLATDINLSGSDYRRLLQLADSRAGLPPRVRYKVLTAYLRTFPQDTVGLVDSERSANAGKPPSAWPPFLRWLASLGKQEDIVKFLAPSQALASHELFPLWADALLATGRHSLLIKVLESGKTVPVSRTARFVLLAECSVKAGARPEEVVKRIETVYQSADGHRGEHANILRAAKVAESQAHWATAALGYSRLAGLKSPAAIDMLGKVYEMQMRLRDGASMLAAAKEMRDLQPGNAVFQKRVSYLQLLLGTNMEAEWAGAPPSRVSRVSTIVSADSSLEDDPFMNLLVCYRMGDRELATPQMSRLADPKSLEPGQRAVAAGILGWLGDQSLANTYLEQVPGRLLLPEEARFLRWLN